MEQVRKNATNISELTKTFELQVNRIIDGTQNLVSFVKIFDSRITSLFSM